MVCGLLYFIVDDEVFVCGYFFYRLVDFGGFSWYSYGWVFEKELKFFILEFKECFFFFLFYGLVFFFKLKFFFWLIELRILMKELFFENGLCLIWLDKVCFFFLFLFVGFYKKLFKEIVLVGSLFFKYVVVVDFDLLNEFSFYFISG